MTVVFEIDRMGHIILTEEDTGESVYVQQDNDILSLAVSLGLRTCHPYEFDGRINCPNCGADLGVQAYDWLHNNEGLPFDDPGYFEGGEGQRGL